MNDAGFTKGEWYINHTGKHWNNQKIENYEICYGLSGECICDTVYEIADAHLIAAAPDMYELLDHISRDEAAGSWKDSIDELLAIARGEQ